MKLFKLILKIVGVLILLGASIIGTFISYDYYEDKKRDSEELSYANNLTWKWHNKYERIQIHTSPDSGRSSLRKVHLDDEYVVYAFKISDHRLSTIVQFIVDCEPNSEIITSAKFADKKPIVLRCNESGRSLTANVLWGKDTDFVWEENFDGFKVRENFKYWNFTKLDQEVTLLKAKEKEEK